MNKLFTKPSRKISWINIQELNLIVILTGYPIISFLPDLLGIDSRLVTIPYRGISLLIALCALFIGASANKGRRKSYVTWLLIIFYFLYILRIIGNLALGPEVNYALAKEEYIFWAVGICFIPMLSAAYIERVDFSRVARRATYILTVVLVISIFNNKDILQSTLDTRVNANSALNTISYGHLGVTLSLLSLNLMGFNIRKIFYFMSFGLGIYIMLISGSRSPVVAFALCLIFWAVVRRNKWVIFALSAIAFVIIVSFTVFIGYIREINPIIVDRLTNMVTGNDHSDNRNLLFNDAIDDFLQSPVTGKHFLLTHGVGEGFYPHNIVLEAFMAIGLIGGCFMIYLVIKALISCVRFAHMKKTFSWVALLFIQFLILGMASGSLWGSQTFWVSMILLFSINSYVGNSRRTKGERFKSHLNGMQRRGALSSVLD